MSEDLIEYLEEKGVEFHLEGKNIATGWIGINCPFCPDGDPSWHLGINIQSKVFSCFKCGTKGYITKLVYIWEGGNKKRVREVMKAIGEPRILDNFDYLKDHTSTISHVSLPELATSVIPSNHSKYLEDRGFDPEFVSKKYKLLYVENISKWKFRIIIPYFIYGRLVAYSSRDITDQQEEKYKHANNQDCIVPVKHCLYNIDSVKHDTIVAVEGPTDVWRVGDGSVGLSGVKYTSLQTKLLRKFKRIFILLDSDATKISYKLAYELAPLVPDVEVVELSVGDPADLSETQIKELRLDIFGKLT